MNSPRYSGRFKRDEDGTLRLDDEVDDSANISTQRPIRPNSNNSFITEGDPSTASSEAADIRRASFLFSIVGVGYLFPFSALTQPVDYWHLLFTDFNIEFPLTVVYMYTNLIMLGILVFFSGNEINFSFRIVGGFLGQFLALLFVPTSYFWHLDEDTNTMAILGATTFAAIVTAFIDSSVIALASQYPLRVQEYFQLGVGISTLVGSLYRDATKIVFPPEKIVESSLLYFYAGAATILVCIFSYFQLMAMSMSKQCLKKTRTGDDGGDGNVEPTLIPPAQVNYATDETSMLLPKPSTTTMTAKSSTTTIINDGDDNSTKRPDKWIVLRKVLFNELMVLLLFMSTLSLWPPLVTEIPSYNIFPNNNSSWWSLILLTIFSLLDCLGRILVRHRLWFTKDNIHQAVLSRLILFPLILMTVKGIYLTHDFISILLVGLLGLTNGYVGTLCIILVNECIRPEEQALAGTYTGFFLNSGLVLGATIGLVAERQWVV